jgi:hypothetical protein
MRVWKNKNKLAKSINIVASTSNVSTKHVHDKNCLNLFQNFNQMNAFRDNSDSSTKLSKFAPTACSRSQ